MMQLQNLGLDFLEVLERFCRDAVMFQKSSEIKWQESFLLIRFHSPDTNIKFKVKAESP